MELLKTLGEYLSAITPAQVCQSYYIFASTCILTIAFLPSWLRKALMDYGARQQTTSAGGTKRNIEDKTKEMKQENGLTWLIQTLEVPHSWFLHFYILSFGFSLFWGYQYAIRGSVMEYLIRLQVRNGERGVDLGRTVVAWLLLTFQGARRLYESLAVQKTGKSSMSSIHWVVALVYYACMSVSIWIEGSSKFLSSTLSRDANSSTDAILRAWETEKMLPNPPSSTVGTLTIVFIIASAKQSECHRHLASLKKYTLPHEGWFRHIVCPHYTAECLVYLSLALIAAPQGRMLNQTVGLGLVFVGVNLGSTAEGTRRWYGEKFGEASVRGKWRMIPFLF